MKPYMGVRDGPLDATANLLIGVVLGSMRLVDPLKRFSKMVKVSYLEILDILRNNHLNFAYQPPEY